MSTFKTIYVWVAIADVLLPLLLGVTLAMYHLTKFTRPMRPANPGRTAESYRAPSGGTVSLHWNCSPM